MRVNDRPTSRVMIMAMYNIPVTCSSMTTDRA